MDKNISILYFIFSNNLINLLDVKEYLNGVSTLQEPILPLVRGSLNKFPDFFRMGTFIDSTHMEI